MIGSEKYRFWMRHPGFNGKSDPPPAPDYTAAANATAAGNLDAVRAQADANRVNQVTPQGTLTYTHTPPDGSFDQAGYDAAMAAYNAALANNTQSSGRTGLFGMSGGWGSDTNGSTGGAMGGRKTIPTAPNRNDFYTPGSQDQGWTATTEYSPDQQAIYQGNVDLSKGLLDTAQSGLSKVDEMLSNPAIDESKLATMPVNPGESYMDAAMRYMQPTQDRQNSQLRTQLANQGITQGSEAYNNSISDQHDQFSRDNLQAIMSGMDKNMTARQQGIQEQNYMNTYPLNIINALRTGNQVQSPNFVNVPQQGYAASPDLLGATNATYQAQLGNTNAQNASSANTMNGLFSLASTALPYFFSDRRLKKNIKRIGTHKLGIGVYEFDYLWDEHSVGVMADEVEKVLPDAVIVGPSGYKMVDYGRL